MEHSLNVPNRFTMILDTETINSVIAHAAQLKLSRRECHPLDRHRDKSENPVLAKYDAEVEAAPVASEELDIVDAVLATADASAAEDADFADDDF
ncbi:MAG: hypothetical protein IH606_17520 [Burkholderiales bacterium]|nr:hypothetical protein [Burkholderiales bacterium]